MKKIFFTILFLISSFLLQSQTINWVGESKSLIERRCSEAGFKLLSDKIDEQKYEITSVGEDFSIFIVFYYKNNYCECQSIIGKCNENENAKLENIIKKHFCESWQEIDSTHIKCGNILANMKKSFGNGTFIYVLWWLNI